MLNWTPRNLVYLLSESRVNDILSRLSMKLYLIYIASQIVFAPSPAAPNSRSRIMTLLLLFVVVEVCTCDTHRRREGGEPTSVSKFNLSTTKRRHKPYFSVFVVVGL